MSAAEMTPMQLLLGAVWYLMFLVSTTCHEAAHAWAAKLGGDPTAFLAGQVTLNPWPHIRREPFGAVVIPVASFLLGGWMVGWASAPYDPVWAERHPRRAAAMALAGPAANFALLLVAAALIRAGVAAGVFTAPETASFTRIVAVTVPDTLEAATIFLSVLFVLNLTLFLFNLIPLPPLDGSAALPLLLGQKAGESWRELTSMAGPAALLLAWYLFDFVFDPAFTLALNLLHPGAGYH